MIDFRYHLVSLISVFLALAVGIVLGAGPLKESIGDTLTGEVDQLRERAAELRFERDSTRVALIQSENAFSAAAPALLDGILEERRIALIEIGGTAGATMEQVTDRLGQAGATVTGVVRVTDAWTDLGRRTFRQILAATLVEYLDPRPAADAGTPAELAEALAQGLTTRAPDDPDALSEEAGVLLQLLAEAGLVEVEGEPTGPADAIVLVVGPVTDDGMDESAQDVEATPEELAEAAACIEAVTELAIATQARSTGSVVAGHDLVAGGLVAQLRENGRTATRVSTVTAVHTVVGQVSVSLALAERIGGSVGHYGADQDATAPVPPRVVLPPPYRPVVVPEEPAADAPAEGTEG